MDSISKIKHSVDSLFGHGVSKFFPDDVDITYSRKTGRIRTVSYNDQLLCTLRIDGGLAITPYLAQLLMKSKSFRENCVKVPKDAASFIKNGRSVFCKHVTWCGKNVRISADTPVLFNGEVIAVGKAVLSYEMISDFDRGVAIKVRDSLKSC